MGKQWVGLNDTPNLRDTIYAHASFPVKWHVFIFNMQNNIIVFIAEEICSWLSPWLAEKMEILSVYARVPFLAFM